MPAGRGLNRRAIGFGQERNGARIGGAEEDRTPDLRIANATLSQLSYGPVIREVNSSAL